MSNTSMVERAAEVTGRARELVNSGILSCARTFVPRDVHIFSTVPKKEELRSSLDSSSIEEKCKAMKRIVAQICKGNDMSSLFTDVVKNIHAPSIELRKLIYFFITYYSDKKPDETLLSVSALQKDLLDSSMHVRALSLRILCSLRIPSIQPVVMLAVKKAASDCAPVVRKVSAIAILQIHSVSGSEADVESMQAVLRQLLVDKNPDVLAAAVLSLTEVFPDNFEFIHSIFRDICGALSNCEEWGQIVLMRLLLRYARTEFLSPNARRRSSKDPTNGKSTDGADTNTNGDDDDDDDSDSTSISSSSSPLSNSNLQIDPDLRLLLSSVKPLLHSLNNAVVLGAVSIFYHCAPSSYLAFCVNPLIRILGGPNENHFSILSAIHTIVMVKPDLFTPYIADFFLFPDDVMNVRAIKFRILSHLIQPEAFDPIRRELRTYLRNFNSQYVIQSIQFLGLLVRRFPKLSGEILKLLEPLLAHQSSEVLSEVVFVLHLLCSQKVECASLHRIISSLIRMLLKGNIHSASAQANILWLTGENMAAHPSIAAVMPDCFRIFTKSFPTLDTQVKKEVLNLGCKTLLRMEGDNEQLYHRFKAIFLYVLELARFDENYEVRERSRLLRTLESGDPSVAHALTEMLLAEKPIPREKDAYKDRSSYELGSLPHLFGSPYSQILDKVPEWRETAPDSFLREPPKEADFTDSETNSQIAHVTHLKNVEDSDSFYSKSSASSSKSSQGSSSSNATQSASYSDSDEESDNGSESESEGDKSSESDEEDPAQVGRRKKDAPPKAATTKIMIQRITTTKISAKQPLPQVETVQTVDNSVLSNSNNVEVSGHELTAEPIITSPPSNETENLEEEKNL